MTVRQMVIVALLLAPVCLNARAGDYMETPALQAQVSAGVLPPVAARLPDQPLLVHFSGENMSAGIHGGTLRTLISKSRDIRYMAVYGYARLLGRDRNLRLFPDILASVDNVEDRIFTLHLRPGHKWSDGHPFTAEDFRYFWDDVVNNRELSPNGPEAEFMVEGVPPKVEIIDTMTVRYSWPSPNPMFLDAQSRASPLFIYRPAHYLKRFHRRYADPAQLAAEIGKTKVRNWAALHNLRDNMYNSDNVDLPTLQPWVNRTASPASRYVFARNPYYHRVDANGRQLPYIDQVVMSVTEGRLIAAKCNAGESDLQARGLSFSDIMSLKRGETRSGYVTYLWPIGTGSQMALYPNLNYGRAPFRAILRDVRFRRALSLGIDRQMINRSLYFGLATESNNTVLPQSELYTPAYALQWSMYDPVQANQLLDQMGLTARDSRDFRILPDGSRLEMIVETADPSTEQSDMLQLIAEDWQRIGVGLFIKQAERETLRARAYGGRSMMSVWPGLDTGMPASDMGPYELAPMTQDQLQWPFWGQYTQTGGRAGEPPDLPQARELLALAQEWRIAAPQRRREIWQAMLAIHADQLFTIGTVSQVRQPVVVSKRLRNAPTKAFYSWSPGAFFGIYRPDQFWFAPDPENKAGT